MPNIDKKSIITTIFFAADIFFLNGKQAGDKKAGKVGVRLFAQFPADIVKTDHIHPAAHILHRCHQTNEITVPCEEDDPVQVTGLQQGVVLMRMTSSRK